MSTQLRLLDKPGQSPPEATPEARTVPVHSCEWIGLKAAQAIAFPLDCAVDDLFESQKRHFLDLPVDEQERVEAWARKAGGEVPTFVPMYRRRMSLAALAAASNPNR